MRKSIVVTTLLAAAFLCGCAENPYAEFEQEMEAFRQEIKNVGMNVVVVRDRQIVYTKSFGMSDLEAEKPMTEDALFRIASISKSFSASSMMQLIEKGLVTLDTDVSELMGFPIRNPKYPDIPITLEMLMSHTSSINDSQGYFDFNGINPETNPNWALCYNDYKPGEGYEYCNLNYNMVGSFIEKLSGERFDQYVVHHVLEPLGLYGGYCVDSLDTQRFAKLYSWNGEKYVEETEAYAPRREVLATYRPGIDTPVFSPTGGMKITATDLAKYMMMHMGYGTSPDGVTIISSESSHDMQTPRSDDEHYGMALWKTDDYSPGVILTGHTGGAYGLRSLMIFSPEGGYGFVVISNGSLTTWTDGETNVLTGSARIIGKHFFGI